MAQGAITGIPYVAMMELAKVIQKYFGAAGPYWSIVWVPVEVSANHVLLIIVDLPQFGQRPFPCCASGDSLTDGRIYIRAEGEPREVNSEEEYLESINRWDSRFRMAWTAALPKIAAS